MSLASDLPVQRDMGPKAREEPAMTLVDVPTDAQIAQEIMRAALPCFCYLVVNGVPHEVSPLFALPRSSQLKSVDGKPVKTLAVRWVWEAIIRDDYYELAVEVTGPRPDKFLVVQPDRLSFRLSSYQHRTVIKLDDREIQFQLSKSLRLNILVRTTEPTAADLLTLRNSLA